MVTCNCWQRYLWLFTGEDLNFGHMFGSCIKTLLLLRTCPFSSSKNDNEMVVSSFGLVLLLAVSSTEVGFEVPQNFRHCRHSRTCREEHSWRGVSAMFWTVYHWLTKHTAVQENCFKGDSNSFSLLLLYLLMMALWAGWLWSCGLIHGRGKWFFCTANHPEQLFGLPNLLFSDTRGCFIGSKVVGVWSWPLTFI
jgi:hypothetical protein